MDFNQQQKIVMVTPYSGENDNNNPTAKKLVLAAVILVCLNKIFPVISATVYMMDTFIDMPFIPSTFNFLFFLAAIIILIVARIQYPGNSMAKGLLIGLIANLVISIVSAGGIVAALYGVVSAYYPAEVSEFFYDFMELFGF